MQQNFPKRVKLVEVSPRDGLQNEDRIIPTDIKVDFINLLSQTGLSMIEATSFVSPKWIPQLADHCPVMQQLIRKPGVKYSALVPNQQGLENAFKLKTDCVAVFTAASDSFTQQNTNCSLKDSVARAVEIIKAAASQKTASRAYISCAWYCPYEEKINLDTVINIADTLYKAGCKEIVISDTIGKATAADVYARLNKISQIIPQENLAVHFHDTYGQAIANIYASLELGISIIDASVSGLGGCPYAKGAGGNVASEDVLFLLNEMDIKTGIDMNKLLLAGEFINEFLQKPTESKVARALTKQTV